MKNILSTAAQNALPSGVRRMFELSKNFDDSINLTLGEPGFPTPDYIIEPLITDKTKFIIINSPSNPTGGVLDFEDLKAIADLVKKHKLFIISDEPYEKLAYDGFEQKSLAAIEGLEDYVLTINSFSKTYAMTGFNKTSAEAAEYISEKTHVVTAPGSAFGPMGEGYIRICYASKYEQIQEALERMKKAFGTKG